MTDFFRWKTKVGAFHFHRKIKPSKLFYIPCKNDDAYSIDAVRLMLDFLGTIISDLALAPGAGQGIVIVGGIMLKIQSVIRQSLF
ncbi:glucokinase [Candidatus Spongiihabitans sp.]|uniref:glucokinase n=1 Tax=Candidatus Spongiihabitans sp. TaxID=3101308 RepID=UPI003C7BBCE5